MLAERMDSHPQVAPAPTAKSVLQASPALLRAAAATPAGSYSWILGAGVGGLLLATAPYLLDVSLIAAVAALAGSVASVAIWYIKAGRNEDAWRTLQASPATIEGALLRRLLDGSKR